MALEFASPNIVLGAGRFFIDRYEENGGKRGRETYIGDTVGATLSATVERQQIFSGDGAVATKLLDKITQVDRTIGITPQDATLDNMALFLIASQAADAPALPASVLLPVGADATTLTDRNYFNVAFSDAEPAGITSLALKNTKTELSVGSFKSKAGSAAAAAIVSWAKTDYEFDVDSGMLRFTKAGITKLQGVSGITHVEITPGTDLQKKSGAKRVKADDNTKQVRVAVRYIEDADEGVDARNIYIPQASVAPAGEAALKSRDTPQQFPLTLGIEQPDGDLAQVYVDGVGF